MAAIDDATAQFHDKEFRTKTFTKEWLHKRIDDMFSDNVVTWEKLASVSYSSNSILAMIPVHKALEKTQNMQTLGNAHHLQRIACLLFVCH